MALTPAQYLTLKAAIAAETDPTFVAARLAGALGPMVDFYNTAGAFIVWKTNVRINDIGDAFNGAELGNLTGANQTRLQTIAQFSPNGVNPSLADRRQFFDDVFSSAATTKAALLALWKRAARRGEALYATGTGTALTPGSLVFEGTFSQPDIVLAINS